MKDHEGEDFSGIDQRLRDPLTDSLFEAILLLNDKKECYQFFQDIATIAEIKALAQRLEVAKLLEKNVTYTTIAQSTGASTATISRVKRCLYFGADGYQMVLRRLSEKEENPKEKKKTEKGEE